MQKSLPALISLFVAWKSFLLIIAAASPGPGYDTSTDTLFDQLDPSPSDSWRSRTILHVLLRLTRWDSVYFVSSATRGHRNEQDWAFSWSFSKLTSILSAVLLPSSPLLPLAKNALIATALSHLSHLLAVIALYHLVFAIIPSKRIAFTAAALHIVSPAGIFLSAPYAESTFALFNFTGMLCYAKAAHARDTLLGSTWTVCSGLLFGLSCLFRSNGLLSGIIFAWDAMIFLPQLNKCLRDMTQLRLFAATILAGILVGAGYAAPQIVAYMEFCTGGATRSWCDQVLPSIYSFVQSEYWGVGFMKYWTLSNLPLFLLAAPLCSILILAAKTSIFQPREILAAAYRPDEEQYHVANQAISIGLLVRVALPEMALVLLTITSFHVQIINRISSGYANWYLVLAVQICSFKGSQQLLHRWLKSESIVKGMIVYALVQGGLFASFLPPA